MVLGSLLVLVRDGGHRMFKHGIFNLKSSKFHLSMVLTLVFIVSGFLTLFYHFCFQLTPVLPFPVMSLIYFHGCVVNL